MAERFGKANTPELIGILNKELKIAIKHNKKVFVELSTRCLNEGVFPKVWKQQSQILLQKLNKSSRDPRDHLNIRRHIGPLL